MQRSPGSKSFEWKRCTVTACDVLHPAFCGLVAAMEPGGRCHNAPLPAADGGGPAPSGCAGPARGTARRRRCRGTTRARPSPSSTSTASPCAPSVRPCAVPLQRSSALQAPPRIRVSPPATSQQHRLHSGAGVCAEPSDPPALSACSVIHPVPLDCRRPDGPPRRGGGRAGVGLFLSLHSHRTGFSAQAHLLARSLRLCCCVDLKASPSPEWCRRACWKLEGCQVSM